MKKDFLGIWANSPYIKSLRKAGAVFTRSGRGPIITIGGIHATVNAHEVLFILHEIFVGGAYDMHFSYPAVVWDIGMNRGLASLYFAKKPQVKAVMAYEPFLPTYRQAQRNFRLNPRLSRKIIPFNVGIGKANRTFSTGYCEQWMGNMRTDGVPQWLADDPAVAVRKERITVKKAGEVLDSIEGRYPGLPIIAKIDCEGAEYEIIEALRRSGSLEKIHGVCMEWHLRGPRSLIATLRSAGFTVFSQRSLPDRGMLYAVR